MLVGYARVSSADQDLNGQVDRLKDAGCEKVFQEKYTGGTTAGRIQLEAALGFVREGDCLVATKLDRIARSATDLGRISELLQDKSVDLTILDQPIDTTTPTGKLMFTMIGAFAEFERDLIRERCAEGIQRAKERGVQFGRKSKLTEDQISQLKEEFMAGDTTKAKLAAKYGISRASLYRIVESTK